MVRIHLIPPEFRWLRSGAYIGFLDSYYLLPLGVSHSAEKNNEEDLEEFLNILFAVERGNDPEAEIEKLSIRS